MWSAACSAGVRLPGSPEHFPNLSAPNSQCKPGLKHTAIALLQSYCWAVLKPPNRWISPSPLHSTSHKVSG
jgi:hypothetical protein